MPDGSMPREPNLTDAFSRILATSGGCIGAFEAWPAGKMTRGSITAVHDGLTRRYPSCGGFVDFHPGKSHPDASMPMVADLAETPLFARPGNADHETGIRQMAARSRSNSIPAATRT